MKFLVALLLSAVLAMGGSVIAAENKTEKPADPAAKTDAKAETKKDEAPAKAAVDPEKTIVKVNGKDIKEKTIAPEINARLEAQVQKMASMGWPMNDETRAMMREQMRDGVVDMLIEKQLIGETLKEKKIEVKDADVDARFDEMVKESGKTAEEVDAELAKMGVTKANIKEQIRLQAGIEKLFEADSSYKAISDEDAKKFYDENPKYFQQAEQVQASHILIKVDEKADEATKKAAKAKCEDLLKKVKAGGDFAALAKENSDCPSKERGGDLGLFGKGQMVPQFEQAAFAMKVGDVSDIVETQFGYHIIKLTDKKEAKTEGFADAKANIVKNLKNQNMGQFFNKLRQDLKDKAKLEWSAEEKARREAKEKEKQQQMEVPAMPAQPEK
ncbi:MAG: peptidylprolyl isomerase [Anaerohalosphaeraceae bacterium]